MTDEAGNVIRTEAEAAGYGRLQRFRAVRRLLRAEVYYGAALAAFAGLTAFAYFNAYFGWDLRTARAVQGVDGLYDFMRLVSRFGDGWAPIALTSATALVFLLFRRRSEAFGLVFSAGGSAFVARLIKTTVGRPRPAADLVNVFSEGDLLSFPSGHVTFYVTYFGFLFFVAYALLPRASLARRLALAADGAARPPHRPLARLPRSPLAQRHARRLPHGRPLARPRARPLPPLEKEADGRDAKVEAGERGSTANVGRANAASTDSLNMNASAGPRILSPRS